MREINYIEDNVFRNLTKKQKLAIPSTDNYIEIEISNLIVIPTNKKKDGYFIGDFFAYTPKRGWWRPMSYDCWKITTEIDTEKTATPKYQILKGDFENGGVNIFGFMDKCHKAYIKHYGEIIIRKLPPEELKKTN